jgi:hypothetical protein
MKEKNRFDLEQEILNAWHIVSDLKVLIDNWDKTTEDDKQNIIIGLMSLYGLKFEALFETYEQCVYEECRDRVNIGPQI